ncbi:tripartite tricarboxylate transporter substrate binding protein [Ramlibacter sp. XY19]|uniref:Bug family tripartite tricarboxylate transporter substrate binding protein n=1 Tax=Ramlibacter paludis TaxID=2908000 RepID=UPI0023DBEE82|nr:tripartite tricarboxylate transporter substrate-binding protein [Ramlibacter paludis]MCG2591348.1 tripartite tricarboxylate transporter substrate binding protein [Ramlibacter paludis]
MQLNPDAALRRRMLLAGLAMAAGPALAQGQKFPSRAVKIVLPQPPGGAADRLGRMVADRLEAQWKQPVVLDNKPGGGVVVGTLAVVRAPADGYTLGLLGSSLSINAVQRKDLPYEIKDLQPLARVGYYTVALVAAANFPANDIKELVALAKKQPANSISFGSNGIGTSAQVAGEMLNHMAGIELQHVPYNGAAKMYTDIGGGVLPLGFSVVSSAEQFIKAGQMKVLGVTSAQRSPLYPQWPTIAETLPGFEAVNWAGFCGPAGMPKDLVRQVGDDLLAVLKAPDMAKALAAMGIEQAPQGPADFGAFIQSEMKRFAAVTRPLAVQK